MKKVERHHARVSFDRSVPPVIEIEAGESIAVETDYGAPEVVLTGPVFVRGAQPGDVLMVTVKRILVLDATYWWFDEDELRGFRSFLGRYCKQPKMEYVPIEHGKLVFSDRLSVPIHPVLGTIGVAPEGNPIPAGLRGTHGGNLDCKVIGEGADVFLPVYVEGALLSLGDVHAAQGDGEVIRCPESRAEVTLLVNLRKGLDIKGPFIDAEDCLHAVGSGDTLEMAVEAAMTSMIDLVSRRLSLNYEVAQLLGTYGDIRICQICGPDYTVRVSLEKRLVPGISL